MHGTRNLALVVAWFRKVSGLGYDVTQGKFHFCILSPSWDMPFFLLYMCTQTFPLQSSSVRTPCCLEAAGKLEAASKTPVELQQQLQQAQQQNQTLARILAERCEQAASHVEQQQQLQDMWQQLVSMHAIPPGASLQVRFSHCNVQVRANFPPFRAGSGHGTILHHGTHLGLE